MVSFPSCPKLQLIESEIDTYVQVSIAFEHLDRRILSSIIHIPVIDTGGCDEAESRLADPLPELNVLINGAGLELLPLFQIEYLQCPRLGLQGDDLLIPVHDGTVGLDGPSRHVVAILEFDNDNFGRSALVLLFSYANVRVGFECL